MSDESFRDLSDELTLSMPNGLRLAAKAWGPPDGQRVLALHGWLDNAASFDALAPLLPSIRLVALDLPGHGLSQAKDASAGYDFVEWVPDVLWAADALDWQRFTLLGHSLGAAIAPLVAAAVPDRIERLLLLDALGPLTAPASEAATNLALAVRDKRRLPPKRLPTYPNREQAAERLAEANSGLSPAAAELLVARGTRAVDEGFVWRYDPRLRARTLLRLTEDQTHALLRAVQCPALLIRASRGWPMPAATMRARLNCVADLAYVEVEGSHHVHLVHPERVAGHLLEFLSIT